MTGSGETRGTESLRGWIEGELRDARALIDRMIDAPGELDRLERLADRLAEVFRDGGKLLACGNGGSACDAMHLCEELTGRFRGERIPLPAIACTDPGHLTCTANDYGYDEVFARWVEALGRPGDALVCFSTSGNSRNVQRAVEVARARGLLTIALLGGDGGGLAGRCDFEWIVGGPVDQGSGEAREPHADRIQEVHMLIGHILIGAIEHRMFDESG